MVMMFGLMKFIIFKLIPRIEIDHGEILPIQYPTPLSVDALLDEKGPPLHINLEILEFDNDCT